MPIPPGLSPKDADQVLRAVMDDNTNRLRVDAVISPDGSDIEIHHEDDSIAIGTPTELFTSTTIGSDVGLDVNVIGGAMNVEISAADGDNIAIANSTGTNFVAVNVDGSLNITDNGGSLTVDSPELTSIDNKTPTLGQKLMTGSSPVVLASDQSLSTGAIRSSSGNLTALNQTVTVSTADANSVTISTSGTFVATIRFESSNDGGTTWSTIYGFNYTTVSHATTVNLTGRIISLPAVGTHIRAIVSAYTSGTMGVVVTASKSAPAGVWAAQGSTYSFEGIQPEGNTVPGVFPVIVGAVYETSPPTFTSNFTSSHFHVDNNGRLIVNPNGLGGAVASGATDAGLPVKIGGVYRSTPPTFTNGQRGDAQLNVNGALKVDGSAVTQPVSIVINDNIDGFKAYSEVSSVASGIETVVVSYTALAGRRTFLQKVSASGDNIAKYRVKINGTTIDTRRTYFGSNLDVDFIFDGTLNSGLEVAVGDVISVTTIHNRPSSGNFNAKIQYIEVI